MNPEELQLLSKLLASLSDSIGASSPFTAGINKNAKNFKELNNLHQKYSALSEKELTLLKAKNEADARYAEQLSTKGAKAVDGLGQIASALLNAVGSMSSMTNSVYNSDKSFTAVVPVLDMVSNVAKGVVEGLGKLASGIPIIGGVAEATAKLAQVGIQMTVDAAKAQLENAQKMSDNFTKMSKAGASFGGSLEDMRDVATKAGMSVDTFGKFIVKNGENLAEFSSSVVQGAAMVGKMGTEIAKTDKKLLAMYGSYDELAGGVSDYMAMMSRSGIDVTKNNKELAGGARDYLYNMRELSELTGKSSDALKKEQEARDNSLAYQIAKNKMTVDERNNTEYALSMISAKYGKRAAEYAEEYVYTGGKVFGARSLQFASALPEMTNAIGEMLSNTKQKTETFNKQTAEVMQSHNSAIKENVDSAQQLAQIHRSGVKDESGYMDAIVSAGSTFYKASGGLNNAVDAQAAAEQNRTKQISDATKVYADTITKLEAFKIGMDDITVKNMPKLAKIIDNLYSVAEQSAKLLDHMGPAFHMVLNTMTDAADTMLKVANGLADKLGDTDMRGVAEKAIDYTSTAIGAALGAGGAAMVSGGVGTAVGGIAGGYAGHKAGGWIARQLGLASSMGGNRQTQVAGLKVKQGDVTGGGDSEEKTISAAQVIQQAFGDNFGNFTSFKDAYHKGFPGSDHNQGLAFDFTTAVPPKDAQEADLIKQHIKDILVQAKMAPRYVGDEYFRDKVAGTTGGHFHVSLPKMAKGGITNGLSIAGEAGPEAVIPLPDGRSVPVKMDLAELIEKFDEMLDIMRDHKDVSEKHMRAAI
jgi:hypothetical protein